MRHHYEWDWPSKPRVGGSNPSRRVGVSGGYVVGDGPPYPAVSTTAPPQASLDRGGKVLPLFKACPSCEACIRCGGLQSHGEGGREWCSSCGADLGPELGDQLERRRALEMERWARRYEELNGRPDGEDDR